MASYGAEPEELADHLLEHFFREEGERDWSVDALIHIALAFYAVGKLEDQGADLEFRNRLLVYPALKRAWRELLHIRKDLPSEILIEEIERATTLSRFGDVRKNV